MVRKHFFIQEDKMHFAFIKRKTLFKSTDPSKYFTALRSHPYVHILVAETTIYRAACSLGAVTIHPPSLEFGGL